MQKITLYANTLMLYDRIEIIYNGMSIELTRDEFDEFLLEKSLQKQKCPLCDGRGHVTWPMSKKICRQCEGSGIDLKGGE